MASSFSASDILDQQTGQQLGAIFFDDLRHAKEIALAHVRQRPWTQRLAERVANPFTRLL